MSSETVLVKRSRHTKVWGTRIHHTTASAILIGRLVLPPRWWVGTKQKLFARKICPGSFTADFLGWWIAGWFFRGNLWRYSEDMCWLLKKKRETTKNQQNTNRYSHRAAFWRFMSRLICVYDWKGRKSHIATVLLMDILNVQHPSSPSAVTHPCFFHVFSMFTHVYSCFIHVYRCFIHV